MSTLLYVGLSIFFVAVILKTPSPSGLLILNNTLSIVLSPKPTVINPSPSSGVSLLISINWSKFSFNNSNVPFSPKIELTLALFSLTDL